MRVPRESCRPARTPPALLFHRRCKPRRRTQPAHLPLATQLPNSAAPPPDSPPAAEAPASALLLSPAKLPAFVSPHRPPSPPAAPSYRSQPSLASTHPSTASAVPPYRRREPSSPQRRTPPPPMHCPSLRSAPLRQFARAAASPTLRPAPHPATQSTPAHPPSPSDRPARSLPLPFPPKSRFFAS